LSTRLTRLTHGSRVGNPNRAVSVISLDLEGVMTDLDPPTDAQPANPPSTDAARAPDVRRRRARREDLPQDVVPHGAVSRSSPERAAKALANARVCARIVDDNRGKDILILDLRKATSLVDFFVIATASSRRQGNAIADEIDQEMKRRKELKLGMEGSEEGRWVLIDYGDFVVHIFSGEARAFYSLEEIWGDAERLEWQEPGQAASPAPEPAG
jgi:ribosome-associated protein